MRKFILLLSLLGLQVACSKTEEPSSIPNYEVYIKTSYAEYTKLKISNNSISYIRSATSSVPTNYKFGFGGVLIYRTLEGKAVAYDLACPVEASRDVLVSVDGIYAVCPMCGSKYDLSYGLASPSYGPAKETLKFYNCIDNGSQIIVSN